MKEFVKEMHDINPLFVDGNGVSSGDQSGKEMEGAAGMTFIQDSNEKSIWKQIQRLPSVDICKLK